MTADQFKVIDEAIARHKVGNRTSSSALLAWFMHVGLRMEDPEWSTEIPESICDGGGDKGIDGLVVSEPTQELIVLQSKHRESHKRAQGDADLKSFVGVKEYFTSRDSVEGLMDSSANTELKALLERLDVAELVEEAYQVRLVFVTNAALNNAGQEYVDTVALESPDLLDIWDRSRLAGLAERTEAPKLLPDQVELPVPDGCLTIALSDGTTIALAPVSARALVELPGISDLGLFALNVRFGVGRTRINRELEDAVTTKKDQEHFLAFHNGVTMLTRSFNEKDGLLCLDGVGVVNGCQSLLAFARRRPAIDESLKVPVRIVAVGENQRLPALITYRSNNQNPINMRDQRSNDPIQRDLQTQFAERYDRIAHYQIKVGERCPENVKVIDNTYAAQLLMSFWRQQPWAAVRRMRLFDVGYHELFYKDICADHIYLAHLADAAIEGQRGRLSDAMQASFSSVRYAILYLVRQLLEQSDQGRAIVADPGGAVPGRVGDFKREIEVLAREAIDSAKFFIEEKSKDLGDSFDPKTVFKSQRGIRELENQCVRDYERACRREESFEFNLDREAT